MTDTAEVIEILRRATEFTWSIQGLGMLRFYISKRERLHVWDSRYLTEKVTRLHTHPWHFTSEVVSGWIRNTIYGRVAPSMVYNYGDKVPIYQQQTIVCGHGGCAKGATETVFLRYCSEQSYTRGQCYTQEASVIHDTHYSDGAVTLVTRTFLEDTEHAQVFIPAGESFVSAQPNEATKEEVKRITSYALENLKRELMT